MPTGQPRAYFGSHGTQDNVLQHSGGVQIARDYAEANGCNWTPRPVLALRRCTAIDCVPAVTYNRFFQNYTNADFVLDATNITDGGDPLLTSWSRDGDCSNDSLAPLPGQSPLIDAGDPALFDRDGTRSDIGAFGAAPLPAEPVARIRAAREVRGESTRSSPPSPRRRARTERAAQQILRGRAAAAEPRTAKRRGLRGRRAVLRTRPVRRASPRHALVIARSA